MVSDTSRKAPSSYSQSFPNVIECSANGRRSVGEVSLLPRVGVRQVKTGVKVSFPLWLFTTCVCLGLASQLHLISSDVPWEISAKKNRG